ncbi:hypothetical protein [Pararhizobium sp. IMCC21322]|uniref:hypothetical protein n=1 Tax=Pararhizobium sp. IMCC21322 TaxID=3067903 RepID=UPI002741554D|nr:hypothetical protein [Pararhizobium sp. IMCC21322]
MQGKLEHHRRLVAALTLIRKNLKSTSTRRLASVSDLLSALNAKKEEAVFSRPALDERMKTHAFSHEEETAIVALTKTELGISDLRMLDPMIDEDPTLVPDVLLESESLLSGESFSTEKSFVEGHWQIAIVYPETKTAKFQARVLTMVLSTLNRDPGRMECLILSQSNTWFGNAFGERQCLSALVRSKITNEAAYCACNVPFREEPIAGIFTVLERDNSSRRRGLVSFYFCGEKVQNPTKELGGDRTAKELLLDDKMREKIRSSVPGSLLSTAEAKSKLPKAWAFAKECGIDLSREKHSEGLKIEWP